MHKNALVWQIGLEHAATCVSHAGGKRIIVHFEDDDVLKLVPLFFTNVNFAAGKLINDLITAEEGHRITRREVKNCAAQLFLCGGRDLNVEPKTNRTANKSQGGERNAHARNAYAISAQRD